MTGSLFGIIRILGTAASLVVTTLSASASCEETIAGANTSAAARSQLTHDGSGSDPARERVSLRLRIDQKHELTSGQACEAVGQIQEIWSQAGVEVSSESCGGRSAPDAASVSLRVIGIRSRLIGHRMVLAWVTVTRAGRMPPVLYVSYAGVMELLSSANFRGERFPTLPNALRERLIARAIGRVAAHELGHYLLQNRSHHDSGLMRAHYSTRDLLGADLGPFRVPAEERFAVGREVALLARLQIAPQ